MTKPQAKLAELGIQLPEAPSPAGSYVPAVRTGNLLLVSGQLPLVDGELLVVGRLGADVTVQQGQQAARQAAINALAIIRDEAGSLERVSRFLRVEGFVASTPEFTDQAGVINGASDFLKSVFGERALHSRFAVGCASLPLGAAVEVGFWVELT